MGFTVEQTYGALSQVLKSAPDLVNGMRLLLDHCDQLRSNDVWGKIVELDLTGDAAYLKGWLQNVLAAERPPDSIVAFWFGLFDGASSEGGSLARLYVAGSESYDPEDTNAEWACAPAYFPAGRYADSLVLRSMSRLLSGTDEDTCRLGSYVLLLGYASLALAGACREIPCDVLLGDRPSRAIAVGFDGGHFITLPLIRRPDLGLLS